MPVIGFVNAASAQSYARPLSAFLKGLGKSGYVDGQSVAMEYRWAEGHYDRLPSLIADLIRRKVNVIAATSTPAAIAAKETTTTIPIVFTTSGDPVKLGLVDGLSRPGGNVTGASQLNVEVAPKRLELIRELLPGATNIALLVNPTSSLADPVTRDLSAAAAPLGVKLSVVRASNDEEISSAFDSLDQLKPSGTRNWHRRVLQQPQRKTRGIGDST